MTERSVEVPRATERSAFDRFAALLQNSERRYDEAFTTRSMPSRPASPT